MYLKNIKDILKLAIPITVSQLGQTLFGLIDSAMIGKVGTVPLSASAFVNNVINVPLIFLMGFCSAVSVLSSHHYGAKNYKLSGKLLASSLTFLTIISILMTLFLLSLQDFLHFFNQPEEVLKESYDYYFYMALSTIPMTLFFGLKHYTESVSKPYAGVVTIFIGLFFNYILNSIFIYGTSGIPAMGLEGAGIATLIARVITVIVLLGYILYAPSFKIFKPEFYKFFDFHDFREIFKIGLPSGFQYLFEVMAFAGSGIMMGWLGTQQLAAHQIVISTATITFMVALGLSFATSVRIGQLQGQNDLQGARQTGFTSFALIAFFNIFCGIFFIVFRNDISVFFVNDPVVWKYASSLFFIAALFQIFDGTQAVGISAHRALKDVRVPTIITFLAYWAFALPLGYFLAFHTELAHNGIWIGLFVGLGISSISLMIRFNYITKKLISFQENVLP